MVSIAGPAHLAFASKSKNNLNQSCSAVIYDDRPVAVSTGVLAGRVSVADCSVRAHTSRCSTSLSGISDEPPRTCAFIRAFGIHAVRVAAAPCKSLTTLVDVVATLSLECVVDGCGHVNALGMMTVVARWASLASETGRQVRAANLRIAWLKQVALHEREKQRENGSKINNAFQIWGWTRDYHLINVVTSRSVACGAARTAGAFVIRVLSDLNALHTLNCKQPIRRGSEFMSGV